MAFASRALLTCEKERIRVWSLSLSGVEEQCLDEGRCTEVYEEGNIVMVALAGMLYATKTCTLCPKYKIFIEREVDQSTVS